MIDDTPTTDDIVLKTHEELLQPVERTSVELTALAGKIQREYKTIGRIPPSEEAVFALLKGTHTKQRRAKNRGWT